MAAVKGTSSAPTYGLLRDLVYEAVGASVSTGAIAVLTEFALTTDIDGVSMTSVREVARRLDRSSGTVARHVGRLVELGFLEQLDRPRADNRRRRWRVAGMDRSDELPGAS